VIRRTSGERILPLKILLSGDVVGLARAEGSVARSCRALIPRWGAKGLRCLQTGRETLPAGIGAGKIRVAMEGPRRGTSRRVSPGGGPRPIAKTRCSPLERDNRLLRPAKTPGPRTRPAKKNSAIVEAGTRNFPSPYHRPGQDIYAPVETLSCGRPPFIEADRFPRARVVRVGRPRRRADPSDKQTARAATSTRPAHHRCIGTNTPRGPTADEPKSAQGHRLQTGRSQELALRLDPVAGRRTMRGLAATLDLSPSLRASPQVTPGGLSTEPPGEVDTQSGRGPGDPPGRHQPGMKAQRLLTSLLEETPNPESQFNCLN